MPPTLPAPCSMKHSQTGLGRYLITGTGYSAGNPAKSMLLQRDLWLHRDGRRTDSHCRHRRRPAGRTVRANLLSGWSGKKHLWHRLFSAHEHRNEAVTSQNGLLTTIAIWLGDTVQYALEGSVFVGGAVIQWLRDELRFFSESCDAEYYAQKVDDTDGVSGSGIHRTRCAALGYVCTRLSDWTDPRHQT